VEDELGSRRINGLLHVFLQDATTIAGERMECRLVWESRRPISRFPERVNARLVRYGRAVDAAPSRFALDDYQRVRTTALPLTMC
jgi:hypothetical protein